MWVPLSIQGGKVCYCEMLLRVPVVVMLKWCVCMMALVGGYVVSCNSKPYGGFIFA